jgi:cholesterol transport system auxiliary component
VRTGQLLLVATLLTACAMPQPSPAPQQYDFGPALVAEASAVSSTRPALALRVQASTALEGAAIRYRLAYAEAQQLHVYAQSRWAMPPAELVQQRLRAGLSGRFAVVQPGEGAQRLMRVELDEFSQVFDAPIQSSGRLHMRVTVLQQSPGGALLLGQHEIALSRPAASADAIGGVHALRDATDAAAQELLQWLQQLR